MSGGSHRTLRLAAQRIAALRGDLLSAVIAEPVPPGSRVDLLLPREERPVSGKVVAVRRTAEGEAEIDLRLYSLPRERRARIEALVSPRS